jgi:ABC-type multidrug transport system ATPase subunit
MRRVALLEELMGNPKFLFLDELTSGLDPYGDYEMMGCLRALAESLHKNIVLVSHNVENLRLSHQVLLLHQGRLCFQGSYKEMLVAHQTTSVVSIFGVYQEASRSDQFPDFAGAVTDLPESPAMKRASWVCIPRCQPLMPDASVPS